MTPYSRSVVHLSLACYKRKNHVQYNLRSVLHKYLRGTRSHKAECAQIVARNGKADNV